MPFFQRFAADPFMSASTSTSADCTELTQADDFWNNQWLYNVTLGGQSLITDFAAATDRLTLETPITGQTGAGNSFQILSRWNVLEVHEALNQALEDAFPAFFDYVTDENIVLQENQLSYSFSRMTTAPWLIAKIWMENPRMVLRGEITSVTSASDFLVSSFIGQFAGLPAGSRYVSIYSNTGGAAEGYARAVTTLTDGTGRIECSAFPATPVVGQKVAVWVPSYQLHDWMRIFVARFDAKEFPDQLYLSRRYYECEGLRLRVEYTARPTPMLPVLATGTADAALTTVVPKEYLLHATLAKLYAMKINDNRVDRSRYASLADWHNTKAIEYRNMRAFRKPDQTLWQEGDTVLGDEQDPLGWRSR
jgi:hypothetical protein